MCSSTQVFEVGIDYEGPIDPRLHSTTETVQLDELDPVLSTDETEMLSRMLLDIEREPLAEEVWLHQYAVARTFIHSVGHA